MQSASSESRDLISWARLLERRVSFALWAAAASCAVLSDEPKNFINVWTTNAAGDSGASGPCRRTACRRCAGGAYRLHPIRLRRVLLDIDFAFKVRALFNRHPLGDD